MKVKFAAHVIESHHTSLEDNKSGLFSMNFTVGQVMKLSPKFSWKFRPKNSVDVIFSQGLKIGLTVLENVVNIS